MLAFSLITNPHLRLTFEEFWLKPLSFFPFNLSQTRTFIPHVTFYITFLQLSLTCKIELIQLLFVIFLKVQLFGALNIYSIITWPIIWLFLFILSISPNQPSKVVSTKLAVYILSFPISSPNFSFLTSSFISQHTSNTKFLPHNSRICHRSKLLNSFKYIVWLITAFLSGYKTRVIDFSTYHKAITRPYSKEWKLGCNHKFHFLDVNNT